MAKEAASPEKLAEALSDAELQVVKSAAQSKHYPLSLDGTQKETSAEGR